MNKASAWTKNCLAMVGVLAIGFWLGAGRSVKASGNNYGGDVEFQLTGVNETSSLLVYQPGEKTVYVYQGANTGNASLQCSYMFQLDRPGNVIHRANCGPSQLIP